MVQKSKKRSIDDGRNVGNDIRGESGNGKQKVSFRPPELEKTIRKQTPKGRRFGRKEDLGD